MLKAEEALVSDFIDFSPQSSMLLHLSSLPSHIKLFLTLFNWVSVVISAEGDLNFSKLLH